MSHRTAWRCYERIPRRRVFLIFVQWQIIWNRTGVFQENDIHVHIPEGAVPKDGPSAGITMATAMLSAIIGREVRADVAMTGEITLRGHVLPIGGLKEKLLAAKYAKIKQVLVPKDNKPDIQEMDAEILDGLKISFVDNMNEVLHEALA